MTDTPRTPSAPASASEPDDAVPAAVPAAEPEEESPEGTAEAAPEEQTAEEQTADAEPAEGTADAEPAEGTADADEPVGEEPAPPPVVIKARRRRDPLASALIGLLTLLLGFAFAVQVRQTDTGQALAGAREEDLVRILDELNAREDRLREQIADQRSALEQLTSSDSQSSTALQEARRRAEAIGILNGTVAARGPGLEMTVRDPDDEVRVADLLDAIQELRGAGAETMQIDGVRVGVSTAVTGEPGALLLDGRPIEAPYQFVVIGDGQGMETAMNIPGGVVQRITGRGGSVSISQSREVTVDALRPLDEPQYASPVTGR
jgi:uncharacterized protein YlxW (UPF0749 family)